MMICARKAPPCGCLQSLIVKNIHQSLTLVKSLWTFSCTSTGTQSFKLYVNNKQKLLHSGISYLAGNTHSYKKDGKSAEKVVDDELDFNIDPDLNIDLENGLKWLNDRMRNSSSQSVSGSFDRDHSQTSSAKSQDATTNEVNQDLQLLNSRLSLNQRQNYNHLEVIEFPDYREQRAKESSGRRPPPLTTDVAVEVVTSELKAVFGLDRYYAHRVASYLRRPYYSSPYRRLRNLPDRPAQLDTSPAATEALVARGRDTVRTLHHLGTSSLQLYHLPMLVKISKKELLSNAPLLLRPGLFDKVSEGLPLLLLPRPSFQRALSSLLVESRYLSQHRNRFYFMADALKVCVGTVACGAAVAGTERMLKMDLVKLAQAMDTFNYYRQEKRYLLTHMDVFLLNLPKLRRRYDLYTRATNPPVVLTALHAAASLRPAYNSLAPSPLTEVGGRSGGTVHDNSAAEGTATGKGGNCCSNGGGDADGMSEELETTSGGGVLKRCKAGVTDCLSDHVPLAEGKAHLDSDCTALCDTVDDVFPHPPEMGYYEKGTVDNYTRIHRMNKLESSSPGDTDDRTLAAIACSWDAATIEELLKDYTPPSPTLGRLGKMQFKEFYNRKREAFRKKYEGEQ